MALRSYGDGDLFAEVYGDDPPRVLALHGWGRRGSDFAKALHGIPALAPDLPGFGASSQPQDVIGAEGYADIVSQVLDAFDGPPVLVGHSFGGRIAVCLAARQPEAFRTLVLTGVPLVRIKSPKPPALSYRLARRMNELGLVSDARMEATRRKRGSEDYRAATGVMRDILVKVVNESYESQLAAIPNEVDMLWGANDGEVPVAVAEAALSHLSNADLEVVDDVGHHLPIQAPEVLRAAVVKALS